MPIIDPFDVKTRPKIVDPFDAPAPPPRAPDRVSSQSLSDLVTGAPGVPRGGTGDWWDKAKRLGGEVYGNVASEVAAPVMKGLGLVGDLYAQAQNAQAAATGYMTDPQGNRMFVPGAVRPELKRLADTGTPTVSPLVNPVAARVAASGKGALPENPSLGENILGGATKFAAPLVAGPVAPLVFGAQAVGNTYDEAKAKGADEATARRAALSSGAVNTALTMVPGEKVVAPFLKPVTSRLAGSAVGRAVSHVLAQSAGGAVVGGGMQTGENVVAQQTYDPTRPLTKDVLQSAGFMALGAPALHAVLSTPAGLKALHGYFAKIGVKPENVPAPPDIPPEVMADVVQDPAVQAILQANGIAPGVTPPEAQTPPRAPTRPARVDAQGRPIINPVDVVADKLQARAVQARAGTIAQTASAARAEEQAAKAALNAATTPDAMKVAQARVEQATAARTVADADLARLGQVVGANEMRGPTPLPARSARSIAGPEAPPESGPDIETLRQGMLRANQNIPGSSGYVDPSTLPVTDRPQPPGAFVVSPEGVARPAEVQPSPYAPALERAGLPVPEKVVPTVTPTSTGAALRRARNLPVPTEPQRQPMSDVEIAQAQRQTQQPQPQPETPTRYVAPEGRQPQTPDQAVEQRQAGGAFDLAAKQRYRVDPTVEHTFDNEAQPAGYDRGARDTQAGGLPQGPQPQTVLLDEGFPVRIIDRGPRGTVKVERYNPRTGQAEEGAEPYMTRQAALKQGTYTPEPRRAQDFTGRANAPRTSPERERMAGPGEPRREPTQTYRTTEGVPGGPEGTTFQETPPEGPPFAGEPKGGPGRPQTPPQSQGPGPFRDQPSGERAQRAWNEEDLRRQEERRQRENAQEEQDRANSARARSRAGGAGKSTDQPKGQDEDGRWFTDEDGYVMSKGGGPIVFENHAKAARWIIDEGQRKSPDQIFERASHPTKRTSTGGRFGGTKEMVTVIEVGRQAKTAEEEAQAGPGPGGAGETSGAEGKAAPEAEPQRGPARGLPGPQPKADPNREGIKEVVAGWRERADEMMAKQVEREVAADGPTVSDEMLQFQRIKLMHARRLNPLTEADRQAKAEQDFAHAKMAEARQPPPPRSPEAQAARSGSPSQQVADKPLPKKVKGETLDEERERLMEAANILDARLRTAPGGEARKKARAQLDTVIERLKANDTERSKEKDATDPFKDHPEVAAAVKELRSAEKAYDRAKDHPDQSIFNRAERRLVKAEAAERDAREGARLDADQAGAARILDDVKAGAEAEPTPADKAKANREKRQAQKDAKFDKAVEHDGPHGDDHEAAMRHLDVEMEKYANDKGQSVEAFDSPRAAAKDAHRVLDPVYGPEGVENDVTFKVIRRKGPDGHIWRWEVIDYAPPDVRTGKRAADDEGGTPAKIVEQTHRGATTYAVEFEDDGRPHRTNWTTSRSEAAAWKSSVEQTGWATSGRPRAFDPKDPDVNPDRIKPSPEPVSRETAPEPHPDAAYGKTPEERLAKAQNTINVHDADPRSPQIAEALDVAERAIRERDAAKTEAKGNYATQEAAEAAARKELGPDAKASRSGGQDGDFATGMQNDGTWNWRPTTEAERAHKPPPPAARPDHVWQREIRDARTDLDAADRAMLRAKTDSEKRVAAWDHKQASARYDQIREEAYAAGFRQEGEAPAPEPKLKGYVETKNTQTGETTRTEEYSPEPNSRVTSKIHDGGAGSKKGMRWWWQVDVDGKKHTGGFSETKAQAVQSANYGIKNAQDLIDRGVILPKAEAKPEPTKDYQRQYAPGGGWKTEAIAEEAAQRERSDPSKRGRDVRVVEDRGGWHVEVERTPADVEAENKRYNETQARESNARIQSDSAARARVDKLDGGQLETAIERIEQEIDRARGLGQRDALRREQAMMRNRLHALNAAGAEPVDVGEGWPGKGEPIKDTKARVASELDKMIERARELDEKGLGDTKLRYEMVTSSGRKATFTMPADPKAWEGLKDRLISGRTMTRRTGEKVSGEQAIEYETVGDDGERQTVRETKKTSTGYQTSKTSNRFETRQTVTRREALLTGAAAAATSAGTTGNARAAVTPPEARRAFVEGPIGKAIKTGRAQNVLDALAEHAISPTTRWIAKIMQKAGGMGKATIGTARELDDGVAGVTDTGTGAIQLRDAEGHPHDGMSEEVAAHELIHSFVTSRYRSLSLYLSDNLRLLHWTPSRAKGAIDEWNAFYDDVKTAISREFPGVDEGKGKGLEAYHQQMWSSPDELLSWSLTNKAAQDYLKGLTPTGEKAMGENMFTRFVDAVAKFFGIYHPRQTALSRALDVSSRIFEQSGDTPPDFKFADAIAAKAKETGQYTKQTLDRPPPGAPSSSKPMSPEDIERFKAMPEVERAKSQFQRSREDARRSAQLFREARRNPAELGRAVRQLYDTVMSSTTQGMRMLARSKMHVDPETAKLLMSVADDLGTDPGSHRLVRETWERAVQGRQGEMVQRAKAIIGEDAHDTEFHKQVIDHMRGLTRAPPGSRVDRVAKGLSHLLDEQYVYMRQAGLDPGYVRHGYVPTVYDLAKIQGGQRTAFLRDAKRVYESMGFTGMHREADGTFKGGTIAEHMASEWLNRLLGASDTAYGASMPHADALKGRTLPQSADAILKPYRVDDLPGLLGDYFHSTSRAAEAARRWGPNNEKLTELQNALAISKDAHGKQGFNDREVQYVNRAINAATGHLYANQAQDKPLLADIMSVTGTLTYLAHSVFSSLPEGAAAGVTMHSPARGAQNLLDSFLELTPMRQGGKLNPWARSDDAHAVARFLGVVGDSGNDMFMSARAGIDPQSRFARHLMGKFFRANLLTQLTEAQRIATVRQGREVMRNWIREAATPDHPLNKTAQMILNEHGIDKDMAAKLHGLLGDNTSFDLGQLSTQSEAMDTYKAAIRRLVDETIQNPTMADKPLYANHPWGRAFYAIQSFNYSNTKNILSKTFKTAGKALDPDLTPQDRLRLAAPVVGLGMMSAAAVAVSMIRDKLRDELNPDEATNRTDVQTWATHMSRANAFGNFDVLANMALGGARFQRNASGLAAGPYASGVAQDVANIAQGLPNPVDEDGLPSLSNTTEWNAYRAAYHLIGTPTASAVAAMVPEGSPLVRLGTFGALQYLTSPQAANAFADMMTGGKTALPPLPK